MKFICYTGRTQYTVTDKLIERYKTTWKEKIKTRIKTNWSWT